MGPRLFNPANLFSFLRISLVPLFAGLMLQGHLGAAFWVYAAAALTDWVDGWMARRFGWTTPLGAMLDPLGDKLVVLSAVLMLAALKQIPAWIAVLALAREILMISGMLLLARYAGQNTIKNAVHSTTFGKTASALVMACLCLALAGAAGLLNQAWHTGILWGLGAAVVVNFISGLDYAAAGFRLYARLQKGEKP
jgi:CDP-diacylglycerol--glycerol-3-phosphate 3-phosphatidyltransferase